jgi:hypothetical protein
MPDVADIETSVIVYLKNAIAVQDAALNEATAKKGSLQEALWAIETVFDRAKVANQGGQAMRGPLYELRQAISEAGVQPSVFLPKLLTTADVIRIIDAFEQAHPTLHESGDCWEVFDDEDMATGEKCRGIRMRCPGGKP